MMRFPFKSGFTILAMALFTSAPAFSSSTWLNNIIFHQTHLLSIGQIGVAEIRLNSAAVGDPGVVVARCTKKINPEFYERFLQAAQQVANQPYPNLQFVLSVAFDSSKNYEISDYVLKPYSSKVPDNDPNSGTWTPWFTFSTDEASARFEVGIPRELGNCILIEKSPLNLWVSQNRTPGLYAIIQQIVNQNLSYWTYYSVDNSTGPYSGTGTYGSGGPTNNALIDRHDFGLTAPLTIAFKYDTTTLEIVSVKTSLRVIRP